MLPHFGVGGNGLLLVLHRLWAAGSVHGHQLLKGYRFLLKEFFILPPIPSLIKILQKPAYLAPKQLNSDATHPSPKTEHFLQPLILLQNLPQVIIASPLSQAQPLNLELPCKSSLDLLDSHFAHAPPVAAHHLLLTGLTIPDFNGPSFMDG